MATIEELRSKFEPIYGIGDHVAFWAKGKGGHGCIVNLYELRTYDDKHRDYAYVIDANMTESAQSHIDYISVDGKDINGYWFAEITPPKSMVRRLRRELVPTAPNRKIEFKYIK